MSTPYMNLDLPTPSTTLGPTWASMLNTALSAVDSHDHTNGKGLPVTPAGLLINAALDFAGNAATDVESVQLSTLASSLLTPSNIHSVNGDLVWTNSSGVAVPITSGNAVVGAPGNIQNLGPPAAAAYDALTSTFQWYSGATVLAGLDAGFLLLRATYNSLANAVQVQAPAAVPSTWTLTLPGSPSGSSVSTLVTVNPSGAMSYYYLDEYTVGQSGTLVSVLTGGIRGELGTGAGTPTNQLALRTIGTANIGLGQITGGINAPSTPTGLLAYRTIATENIEERAVTTAKVALDTITGGSAAGQGNLAQNTIRSWNIPNNEIDGDKLTTSTVLGLKIQNYPNGISNSKINSASVDARTLATNAVETTKILDGAVTYPKTSFEKALSTSGFVANGATLPLAASKFLIASTISQPVSFNLGAMFKLSLNLGDQGGPVGSSYLYAQNNTGSNNNVYIEMLVLRSGFAKRTYSRTFFIQPGRYENLTMPVVMDTITDTVASGSYYADVYIYASSGSNMLLWLNDLLVSFVQV